MLEESNSAIKQYIYLFNIDKKGALISVRKAQA